MTYDPTDPLAALNINTADVDTSFPVLPKGKVVVEITAATVEPNKRQDGSNLKVEFKTMEDKEDTKGNAVAAGFALRRYFPLQQSSNEKARDFRIPLTKLVDAAFGITNPAERPAINRDTIEALVGRQLIVTLKIESNDDFGDQNAITDGFAPLPN